MMFSPLGILLMVSIVVIVGIAQWRVRSAYKKYSKVTASSGMTARQVAQRILEHGAISLAKPQLRDVKIESVPGKLTDHYDPRSRTLRLSHAESRSLADIGVAAHEAGHALQDAANYQPLVIRSALVPATQFGSHLASFLVLGAMFAGTMATNLLPTILLLIVIAYSLIVVFSLVTLPVEFNASKRAMKLLRDTGAISSSKEMAAVGTVLNSAALTYVAAAASAIMTLVYYAFLLLGQRR